MERHVQECNNPKAKKLVLNVKSIKFAKRAPKKGAPKNSTDSCSALEGIGSKIEKPKVAEIKRSLGQKSASFKLPQNKPIYFINEHRETLPNPGTRPFKRPSTKEDSEKA